MSLRCGVNLPTGKSYQNIDCGDHHHVHSKVLAKTQLLQSGVLAAGLMSGVS